MALRRVAVGAIAVLAVGMLAGCDPVAPNVALPEGASVELVQLRSDVADRTAQVRVHNGSTEEIAVSSLAVDDPRFVEAIERDKETVIAPGRTVDLRVELPASSCVTDDGQAIEDDGEATLTLRFESQGEPALSTVPLPDPLGFVPQLHARECLREALAEIAAIEWTAFAPSPPGVPAELTLGLVSPGQGNAEANLVSIHTTNLLKFTLDGAEPFSLDVMRAADDGETSIEVPLVPWRCDPHAVMEDKRGTVFTLDVEVDGRAGPIEVAAPPEMRAEILTWVTQWCGFAS